MKFFGSLTSPFVRKVRILVIEKQLPVQFVAVENTADPQISARNPLGKIPVLERDDGSVLFDSPVICEYLDTLTAPPLMPAAGEARWQVLRWAALADGMAECCVERWLELRRAAPLQSADVVKRQEGKILRGFDFAERTLQNEAWLVEGRLTLADIALAVTCDYIDFRYLHDWRSTHPRLTRWHTVISARPSFVQTHPPTPK